MLFQKCSGMLCTFNKVSDAQLCSQSTIAKAPYRDSVANAHISDGPVSLFKSPQKLKIFMSVQKGKMRRLPDELGFSLGPDIKKIRALPADMGFIDREKLTAARADFQRNVITAVPSFSKLFNQQNEAMGGPTIRLGSQKTASLQSLGMNYSPNNYNGPSKNNTPIVAMDGSLHILGSSSKISKGIKDSPTGKRQNLSKKSSLNSLTPSMVQKEGQ